MFDKMRAILIFFSLLTLFLLLGNDVEAQCAMCKAVAENAQGESGYGIANGLNNGILYIMAIPYILLAVLFVGFYRKQIRGFWRSFNQIH